MIVHINDKINQKYDNLSQNNSIINGNFAENYRDEKFVPDIYL